jgi:hypothetical protein
VCWQIRYRGCLNSQVNHLFEEPALDSSTTVSVTYWRKYLAQHRPNYGDYAKYFQLHPTFTNENRWYFYLNNLHLFVVKHCFFRLRSKKGIVLVSMCYEIIIIFIIIIIIIIICVVYRTFTIWYLRQTTFCCSVLKPYGTCNVPSIDVKHFNTSTSRSVCAVPNVAVFGSLISYRAFPVCCFGIFWIISRGFQLPLLLLVSLLLYIPHVLYFCCVILYYYYYYIEFSFWLYFLSVS